MLASLGSRFASYSWDNGNWKEDKETIGFTAEGRHYVVSDDRSRFTITFAAIATSWWAMQAEEKGKSITYSLIEAKDGALLLYPLSCKPLHESGKFEDFIAFNDDDCFVKDGVDKLQMFKALATQPGQPNMKLVLLP
ncbi:MAG: hypothetical protein ACREDX_03390 [Aestuariivirga sp.]